MPISSSVRLGDQVTIHHPELVNLYGCAVGDETKIGAFVEIQAGAFTNNLVTFDSRGIATGLLNVSGGAICIPSAHLRPNTNCILVTPTRIRMGKYSGAAGGCSAAACN